jgi:hypothetical protein
MIALLCFVMAVLAAPFKSKSRLEAENAALRHQLIVLRRKVPGRVRLTNNDRWFFIQLYRWVPSILKVLSIIRPETLVRRPCACPEDTARNGSRCGRRSAYNRPGGATPRCYVKDVMPEEITNYRNGKKDFLTVCEPIR